MTDSNYTHITLVADRSGSMASVRADAEGAINQFISDQKDEPGRATLLLVDFDASNRSVPRFYGNPLVGSLNQWQFPQYAAWNVDDDWYRQVYKGDLQGAPKYHLHPRGGTALNDAVARAIQETGSYLSAMPESTRPGKVIFVVQTDGGENASKRFTLEAVNGMVTTQQNEYSWEFVFLGMGLDVAAQGHAYGFNNVLATNSNVGAAYGGSYAHLGAVTRSFRSGAASSMGATNVVVDDSGAVV